MTQALYAHMNNKRKKSKELENELRVSMFEVLALISYLREYSLFYFGYKRKKK
jgi:transcription initiation factor IIE alpha subunit